MGGLVELALRMIDWYSARMLAVPLALVGVTVMSPIHGLRVIWA